jgi:hypothetical protein
LPSISKGEARNLCQGLHCFRRRLKSNYHGHNTAIPFDHQKKDLGNTQCPLTFCSEGIKATLLDFYPVGSIAYAYRRLGHFSMGHGRQDISQASDLRLTFPKAVFVHRSRESLFLIPSMTQVPGKALPGRLSRCFKHSSEHKACFNISHTVASRKYFQTNQHPNLPGSQIAPQTAFRSLITNFLQMHTLSAIDPREP